MIQTLDKLLEEIRQCKKCEPDLALGARPVLQVDECAKILIAGQAPGKKVHLSGIPFDDASGKRLRQWLGLTDAQFYDAKTVAILPMAFCYPGTGKSGDLAPPIKCAKQWREPLLEKLGQLELTVILGSYAQLYHLGDKHLNVTEQVKAWLDTQSNVIPLPHPSPRNNIWLHKNPWFEEQVLPCLQTKVRRILSKS